MVWIVLLINSKFVFSIPEKIKSLFFIRHTAWILIKLDGWPSILAFG